MCNMKAIIFIILLWFFFYKNMSNVKVKIFITNKKILSHEIFMWNMTTLALSIEKLLARLKLSKRRPNSNFEVTCHKCWDPRKCLVTKNTYVKYQSFSTHCSKFISKVRDFIKKKPKLRSQVQKCSYQQKLNLEKAENTSFQQRRKEKFILLLKKTSFL